MLDLLEVPVAQVLVFDLCVIAVKDFLGDLPLHRLVVIEDLVVGVHLLPRCDVPGIFRQGPAVLLYLLIPLDRYSPLPGLGINLQALGLGHHHEDQKRQCRRDAKQQRKPASSAGPGGLRLLRIELLLQLLLLLLLGLLVLEVVEFTVFPRRAACRAEFVFIRIERIAVGAKPVRIFIDLVRVLHIVLGTGHIKRDIFSAGLSAMRADLDLTGDPVRAAVVAVPAANHNFSHMSLQS